MPKMESIREIGRYLKERKAYWLAPLLIMFLLLAGLLLFAASGNVAPFVYTLF